MSSSSSSSSSSSPSSSAGAAPRASAHASDPVLSLYSLDRDTEFHCANPDCNRNISHEVRILCQDSGLNVCMQCFMKGEEFGAHKSDSPYAVVDNLTSALFKGGWEVAEELALLEGIDLYGFGNWKAVSIHIGSRTPDECSKHYDDTFGNR